MLSLSMCSDIVREALNNCVDNGHSYPDRPKELLDELLEHGAIPEYRVSWYWMWLDACTFVLNERKADV